MLLADDVCFLKLQRVKGKKKCHIEVIFQEDFEKVNFSFSFLSQMFPHLSELTVSFRFLPAWSYNSLNANMELA